MDWTRARCMRRGMMQKRHFVPVKLLLDAYSLPIMDLVLGCRNRARVLLRARPSTELDGLVDHRRDRLHARALGEGRKLDDCSNAVPGGPGLVRYHDGVHEFLGPCVLDLESLLILEGLRAETAQDGDGVHGMEFSVRETGEAWAHHSRAEFIVDRRAA